MVLRSLHRLSPLAQRFLCVENLKEFFFCAVLSQGLGRPLPHPLIPVCRFFFAVAL